MIINKKSTNWNQKMKYFCKFLYGINQKLFVYFFYFSLSYIYCSKIAKKDI